MKQITWEINCLSTPHITRYCKKCKTKAEFQSSGAFRVNAQKKTIDVWLIYKCINCDSTWNMTIYTRITPGSIPVEILKLYQEGVFQLPDGRDFNRIRMKEDVTMIIHLPN